MKPPIHACSRMGVLQSPSKAKAAGSLHRSGWRCEYGRARIRMRGQATFGLFALRVCFRRRFGDRRSLGKHGSTLPLLISQPSTIGSQLSIRASRLARGRLQSAPPCARMARCVYPISQLLTNDPQLCICATRLFLEGGSATAPPWARNARWEIPIPRLPFGFRSGPEPVERQIPSKFQAKKINKREQSAIAQPCVSKPI